MPARVTAAFGLLILTGGAGCAAPGVPAPASFREPGLSPGAIRRPVVLLDVSLDRATAPSELSDRERAEFSERYAAAVLEALNGAAILPLEVRTPQGRPLGARPEPRSAEMLGPSGEAARELERARGLGAEHLVVVTARLGRRPVAHCRATARPMIVRTTWLAAALEVYRVADGRLLLREAPGADGSATDLEPDCGPARDHRRKSIDELIDESVRVLLAPLSGP